MAPARGEVYQAQLDPIRGSEQGGERPVVVMSRDAINRNSPVVIVIPLTDRANRKKTYPSHVVLNAGDGGLRIDSIALGEQIRAIAVSRLSRRLGQLSPTSIDAIGAALRIALDL